MIVLIDNLDSFTYNLVHYFEQIDSDVRVFQNEDVTASCIAALSPDLIVLSPGPGSPVKRGASKEVLQTLSSTIPILGVCLGHQTIVEHFGGTVIKGAQPVHGKQSCIRHSGEGVFSGLSVPLNVVRYHSLIAEESSLPACLSITARSEDGVIMGIRHRDLPVEGVQFHPESVLTESGFALLRNAYEQGVKWKQEQTGGDQYAEPVFAF